MMNLSTISILLCISSSLAFLPSSPPKFGKPLKLYSERPDSTEAIQAALTASEKFGSTSKEARLAWETVEELDSSDNSVAYAASSGEYDDKIEELSTLLSKQKKQIEAVKNLASELRAIKLSSPDSATSPGSPQMIQALDDAKDITEKEGVDSSAAKLAWEVVENIASNDLSEALKKPLDEECLIESIEACDALEELEEALYREKTKAEGRYQG